MRDMKRSDPVFFDRIDQCACRDNKETYGLYGSDPINVGDTGTEHGKNLLSARLRVSFLERENNKRKYIVFINEMLSFLDYKNEKR